MTTFVPLPDTSRLDSKMALETVGDVVVMSPLRHLSDESDVQQQLGEFVRHLESTDVCDLIVDMQHLEMAGTADLNLLLQAWREIKPRGGRLALCATSPFVIEVLEIVRFNTLWEIHSSRTAALQSLSATSSNA